jgi:hypothetical protein
MVADIVLLHACESQEPTVAPMGRITSHFFAGQSTQLPDDDVKEPNKNPLFMEGG